MQWSTEPNAGFTQSDRPCSPVIDQGPYGFEHVNAAKQRRDPNSMMNWIERIIRMRKEVPEIGWGDFKVIGTRDPAVLVIRYDWRNNSVLSRLALRLAGTTLAYLQCYSPIITPSLPRRSRVPSTFSPSRSRDVESRISPFSPTASDSIETG